jgi:hypothetical protein
MMIMGQYFPDALCSAEKANLVKQMDNHVRHGDISIPGTIGSMEKVRHRAAMGGRAT